MQTQQELSQEYRDLLFRKQELEKKIVEREEELIAYQNNIFKAKSKEKYIESINKESQLREKELASLKESIESARETLKSLEEKSKIEIGKMEAAILANKTALEQAINYAKPFQEALDKRENDLAIRSMALDSQKDDIDTKFREIEALRASYESKKAECDKNNTRYLNLINENNRKLAETERLKQAAVLEMDWINDISKANKRTKADLETRKGLLETLEKQLIQAQEAVQKRDESIKKQQEILKKDYLRLESQRQAFQAAVNEYSGKL